MSINPPLPGPVDAQAPDAAGQAPPPGGLELRFMLAVATLLAAITSIPYILGVALGDGSTAFDTALAFEPDTNSYLAYMRQASRGQLLFHNPFTPEPHGNVLLNLEWLAGGWMAAFPGSSPEVAWHVLRLGAIFALVWTISRLCGQLLRTRTMRRIGLVALATGSGFGWLLLLPGSSYLQQIRFIDQSTGLHPFFWMLLVPHFALGQVCATSALVAFLRAEASRSGKGYLATGIWTFATGVVRPFDMLVLLVTLALYVAATVLLKGERDRVVVLRRVTPGLTALPVVGYYYWLFHLHPVYRWWYIQNVLAPPEPLSLALGLGLLGPILLFSLDGLGDFARKPHRAVLVACAFLAAVGVTYSNPLLRFTRQALTTIAIPAALVALQRVEEPLVRVRRKRGGLKVISGLLLVNAAGSALLFTGTVVLVARGRAHLPRELVAAYRWFGTHAGAREVIMSSLESGNRIPRYALATTFYGYQFSTVDAAAKSEMVNGFYSDEKADDYRLGLVSRFGVRYVFYGPAERTLGGWDPARAPWLTQVFRNEVAAVYSVRSP